MKLIRPTVITDALLVSSDVPEGAGTAWNSGTTYAAAARADITTGSQIDVYSGLKNGNMLLWSEDFGNAVWGKDAGITYEANTFIAPDGTKTADTVSDTSATSICSFYQAITIPNDGAEYTASVYMKKYTAPSSQIVVSIQMFGGTSLFTNAYVDPYSGAAVSVGAGAISVVDAGAYWRISATATNNTSGNTGCQLAIFPAFGPLPPNGAGGLAATTGSVQIWGAQIEKGGVATAYTATTSAAIANLNNPPATSPSWWQKLATTYAAYNPTTNYGQGAIVSSSVTHRRYESVQAANVGHALSDPAWWLDIGPTNRWAMFDQGVGSVTTETGSIQVVLAPGSIDSLVVLDTDAELVTVTLTNGGTTVYSVTQSTNVSGAAINSWFTWFFSPIGKKTTLTWLDLPPYPNGVVAVTFTGANPAGAVSVGSLIVGRKLEIGSTEVGVTVGITDYSKKDTDDFGVTNVVERAWSKRMELRCMLDTAQVDAMERELAKVRATPCVWIGEDGFDSLTIYGFYKDFSLDLAYANISYCTLTVEGLT